MKQFAIQTEEMCNWMLRILVYRSGIWAFFFSQCNRLCVLQSNRTKYEPQWKNIDFKNIAYVRMRLSFGHQPRTKWNSICLLNIAKYLFCFQLKPTTISNKLKIFQPLNGKYSGKRWFPPTFNLAFVKWRFCSRFVVVPPAKSDALKQRILM